MRSDFEPKAIRKAKAKLQKELMQAESYREEYKTYRQRLSKPSLIGHLAALVRRLKLF